ncbi:MAG: GSCFA domain-containing protein [Candidatus Gracilibacteria bacterium]
MKSIKEQLFRTVVEIPESTVKIDHTLPTLMIGSCFTENMGAFMQHSKFPIIINPTGIVYNPLSALRVLEVLMSKKIYTASDLFFSNGLWASYDHHGSFSSSSQEECLTKINTALSNARAHLEKTKILFITFGTSWIYRLKVTGKVVSNCHKQPDTLFERSLLKVDEITDAYKIVLEKLHTLYPDLHVVFTVSPIRHWKEGAHNNQISKSLLHISIEKLTSNFSYTGYFPSYEIVMDELRDYRFYTEDMLHISDAATRYIWERFQETFMSPETRTLSKEIEDIQKSLLHRPFNSDTTQHNQFRDKLSQRIQNLVHTYPFLIFEGI